MKISLVVAASQNGVIGRQGDLPWRLPADLARFKSLTMGHPIIMGRKTYESIGRPLPGRRNIVISRDKNYKKEGIETAGSLEAALVAAGDSAEVSVIGGESIFADALKIADQVYLTRVEAKVEGDKYFHFSGQGWRLVSSEEHAADKENQFPFKFQEWVRQ
jgi:dihydrofolate reductase